MYDIDLVNDDDTPSINSLIGNCISLDFWISLISEEEKVIGYHVEDHTWKIMGRDGLEMYEVIC